MKKILAIHSSEVFFKNDAPNFYEWLCGRRGLEEFYQDLKERYKKGKKDPLVLADTFGLAVVLQWLNLKTMFMNIAPNINVRKFLIY